MEAWVVQCTSQHGLWDCVCQLTREFSLLGLNSVSVLNMQSKIIGLLLNKLLIRNIKESCTQRDCKSHINGRSRNPSKNPSKYTINTCQTLATHRMVSPDGWCTDKKRISEKYGFIHHFMKSRHKDTSRCDMVGYCCIQSFNMAI